MDASELGSLLVKEGLISKDQLEKALKFQREVGGRLPVVLVKLGYVDERRLVDFFGRNQGLPVINVEELILPENLIKRVPRQIIERHNIIPIAWKDETLTVVTFDPYDLEALEELQIAVDCRVQVNIAPRSQIIKTINEFFYAQEEKTKEQLAKEMEEGASKAEMSPEVLSAALLGVLLDKKIVTKEELFKKAKDLGLVK